MERTIGPGTIISEYVLEAEIGHGGSSRVFRGRHRQIPDRLVAIKIPHDGEAARTLLEEGRALSLLDHPRIVRMIGLDLDGDPPWAIMEYVDGESLRSRLSREVRLPAGDALAILRDVLEALAAAHARGVLHLDVKPENILLDRMGRARLSDFGFGRAASRPPGSVLLSTATDGEPAVGGTFGYMPREQLEGRAVDRRTDLYAAGVVLFEMVTGVRPEFGDAPSRLVPSVPPVVDRLFSQLCARIENRFDSAEAALRALDSRQGDVFRTVRRRPDGSVAIDPPAGARAGRLSAGVPVPHGVMVPSPAGGAGSVTLGIFGLLFSCVPAAGLILGTLAIATAPRGRLVLPNGTAADTGRQGAGFVLGILAVIINAMITVVVVVV